MNNIKDYENLSSKRVLLRLDLNVPLKNGDIVDETRIIKIIPVIEFLIKRNAKILIISHVGRPKGKFNKDLSLKPICDYLEKKIQTKVNFISEDILKIKRDDLFKEPEEKVIFFENIRFYAAEEKNESNFSKHLASFADLFVNDAFSCSHRTHASVCKITEFLPSFAGLQFETEVNALKKVTIEIKKPITCIIGGSKISTKIDIIKNLIPKFNNIIFVGGMANNFIEYFGNSVGKSIKEKNCHKIVEEIISLSKKEKCKIIYPEDVIVSNDLNGSPQKKELNEILFDEMILDIGPKTIYKITKIIDNSKTILWNGPAGYFENPNFSYGSIQIAKKIIEKNKANKIFSVAGGGDTVSLINNLNAVNEFNFVSTAGGAFLEYLEGKNLPGITALN